MPRPRRTTRFLAAVALVGTAALGACTNSGSDVEGANQTPAISGRTGPSDENPVGGAPNQAVQTPASQLGSIGPGSAASTLNVNANTESTQTPLDSTPDLRPDAGPGSE